MITLKNLSKIYRTEDIETTALNDINLVVNSGDFLAIMGPSGCGKSTLLSILGMLESHTSGEYLFLDEDLTGKSEHNLSEIRKSNIGFIFQSFNLIDDLTVFENVVLPLQYLGVPKEEREQRTEAILKRVGIDHRANHLPQFLSGGQQQRVAVARALVINPKVVLADEPTGNLDSKNGEDVMQLLRDLNSEGTTVIMVTHSEVDAQYGNRIVRLFDGKIIAEHSEKQVKEVDYAE
ncbi:ABC transporter ATP-binding protein [Pleionea litopenaei]|uniref:ABC transporter ATP-binding protein n=1 Tax=Pleionea litopenaei TaxID=3070815 RepID=A0AA51X6P4_9GAMM|nr:ABC transporter ATP-binding protein [Pleionea sp. HL-JVS1]WMS87338.1 ABC transporter ATP-binding protein [Pleionea sp. HL-JVS1]